ncbi:MAG TPA: YfiR family protein, partial [Flavisolibacter sp.]|nr:YfiR family protein [Flavisolibacter sp.]
MTLLLFLLALISVSVCAQSTVAKEYQVKAVFLYNFTQFVEWPAAAGQATQPFVIGILGTDP